MHQNYQFWFEDGTYLKIMGSPKWLKKLQIFCSVKYFDFGDSTGIIRMSESILKTHSTVEAIALEILIKLPIIM